MIARRLVEAGSTLVTVHWESKGKNHWDLHGNNFGMLKVQCPQLDRLISAFVLDLEQRGLLDSTLFVTRAIVRGMPTYNMWGRIVYAIGLIVTWAHLWIGLRRHLEFTKGWAVSAACLAIGHLTGLLVMYWYLY